MAQLSIQDIIRMMGADPRQTAMGQVSNTEADAMKAALAGAAMEGMPRPPVDMNEMYKKRLEAYRQGMESAPQPMQPRMAQNPMEAVLSLPANEMQRNYADGQMPLYTGGLLQNPQGDMVDPQQLLNVAYDMSAPREMRINAIERLRALGIQ